jgi:hypothetical protein
VSGLDFLLKERTSGEVLRAALAGALGLPVTTIDVATSIADTSVDAPVAAEYFDTRGDFAMQVSLYVKTAPVEDVGLPEVRELSRTLGVEILMPDESPDPYVMLLVQPTGDVRRVGLDPESLDVRGEYRLADR